MTLSSRRVRLLSRGDLPGSNGGIYNPGAVLIGSSIVMLCRREIDYRFSPIVFAELVEVDPDTLEVVGHRTLRQRHYPAGTRLEDFRAIEFEGSLLAAHAVVKRGRSAVQMISRASDGWLEPYDDFDVPLTTEQVEKNWVLFERDRALHCLYRLDPLTMLVRTPHPVWEVVKQEPSGWIETFGENPSNSTNLIPFLGGHLGFWHTRRRHERYVQGAFLLNADLELTHRTDVLLDGAQVRDGHRPGALYVSSLVEHAGRVLAFYGEGDAHTGVAIFDRDELQEELLRSPFELVAPLRVRFDVASMGDLFRSMRTLERFSREKGSPRIDVYVEHSGFRDAISVFGIPNLAVRLWQEAADYDYTLSGETDVLVSRPPRR